MSRSEDIDNAIWDEADFYALNGPAKLVYIWSWTNRRCDFSGIYQVPLDAIVSETKHDEQTVRAALVELEQAEFVFYDGMWLWCKARVKRIRTGTVQMCKAIVKDLARVPEPHPYRRQLLELQGGRVWQSKDVRTTIRVELESLANGTRVGQESHQENGSSAGKQGYHPSGTGVPPRTRTGTGTGTPRGWGVGRGNRSYEPSADILAIQSEHFPAVEVTAVEDAAQRIRRAGLKVTPEALRDHLASVFRDLGVEVEGVTC